MSVELSPSVYGHLRAIAGSYFRGRSAGDTLQPTALVNEAFMKLAASEAADFESREHFVAVAARAMRQILVDHARRRNADKRGGNQRPVTLTDVAVGDAERALDLVALDDALSQLATLNARHARVVELRFFGGLSVPEVAQALGISVATVEREWKQARAWLLVQLDG